MPAIDDPHDSEAFERLLDLLPEEARKGARDTLHTLRKHGDELRDWFAKNPDAVTGFATDPRPLLEAVAGITKLKPPVLDPAHLSKLAVKPVAQLAADAKGLKLLHQVVERVHADPSILKRFKNQWMAVIAEIGKETGAEQADIRAAMKSWGRVLGVEINVDMLDMLQSQNLAAEMAAGRLNTGMVVRRHSI